MLIQRSLTLLIFLLIGFISTLRAQNDTLFFANDEYVVGEIKKLERSVVTIKTDYSDSDFLIDWDAVIAIKSSQFYLITVSDGRRLNGSINSTGDGYEVVISDGIALHTAEIYEIVNFKAINDSFLDRFSVSIDLGLNLTKANNLTQFNSRVAAGYLAKRWELNGNLNTVFSRQDSIADTKRMDANITFKVFLPKDWFVSLSNDFLQNDEQKLALRSTTKLGIGNYVVNNNTLYFAIITGAAYNHESFTEEVDPDRSTAEAYGGLEFNMFDAGDISLLSNFIVYPNLTEEGRVRYDFKLDLKYDLPLDFYIKAGTTINYDNRPVAGAADFDYVIQTGIGWEW